MNEQEKTQQIKSVVFKDVEGLTKLFVPLYLDWVTKKAVEYADKYDERTAFDATINLLENGLRNILMNSTSNFLRRMEASSEFCNEAIDLMEKNLMKVTKHLRERCKDGFEEENK